MENHISSQLILFGQSVLLGMGGGLLYDLLRPLRTRRPRLTGLSDVLYCLAGLLCLFLFVLRRAGGELRIYALLGLGGGAVLHFSFFSQILRPVWDFWADTLAGALRLLSLPVRKIAALCKKVMCELRNLFYFMKKWVTIEKIGGLVSPVVKRGAEGMSKTAEKKKKKNRAGFFTKLLLLVLLVALGWQLYRLHGQVEAARAQKAQLTAQVEQQKKDNAALQKGIDDGGSEEEMEKIARDELGLVSPGERVYHDTNN
ncbi:MAG: septum formation initiator family protein [Oscillibacter sp.]|jgi:cell division protein FtsB|nr:septum formation initiator family protein [Oscillibacter sp.]